MLAGKSVLVTGAANGIGQATAVVLARHGAAVVVADIDEENGSKVADSIIADGGKATFVAADVTTESGVKAMIKSAVDTYGSLDCAVNNAGVDGERTRLHDSSDDNWNRVIAVDLTGVRLALKHEVAQMLRQPSRGAIVNMSSAAGLVGVDEGLSAYVAAKHGVIGLTRVTALEYATEGIRVNAVCPGVVRTPMLDRLLQQGIVTEEFARGMHPVGRLAEPSEVAEAIAWLCSDAASFVTGHPLAVDGGMTAR
ncbi:short chain dehydrogenase [Amycolatopsis sp. WAC 04197]|uniref:glucose 1-dehydrogenase n=1 Tax=Amycolatopsis sp. WAC 04197 TaxID=2203199 RepID=UPI000F79AC81|nr:glucose 1-dehydrogenase [Amycolatopsis sp. WAC 04197]RSN39886.1 short chain dehydrogenase [Amycolatopsis sp. WAC 04197]